MNDNNITDVDFKEVATEAVTETEVVLFDPVDYLTGALRDAGHPNPTAWTLDIDPRAQTAPSDKDRIFFANRALCLYVSEHEGRENITPRLLLVDGIDKVKWAALMEQGIVPWLMNKFDAKGKIIKADTPTIDATDLEGKEVTITANDGGPVANEDGSARQEGDFVPEPTYKGSRMGAGGPRFDRPEEQRGSIQYQTPGVYIKLEDNDPDPQGADETVLGEVSIANTQPKEIRVFEGSLNLTEKDKAIIREFVARSEHDHIVIENRTIAKVYRNGAIGLEWYFTNGSVTYPLPDTEYSKVFDNPEIIAEKINSISKESRVRTPNTDDPLYIGTYLSQESFEQSVDPKNFKDGSWANVAGVGVFIKLDDSFAIDHAQVETVLGDGGETHLWGNIHPNDMPVIMGVDTGTEVLPFTDMGNTEFTPGDDEPLCCDKPTDCDHLNIPCHDRIEADQAKARGKINGLIATDEFGKPIGDSSLTKLDIDPKYLDVK